MLPSYCIFSSTSPRIPGSFWVRKFATRRCFVQLTVCFFLLTSTFKALLSLMAQRAVGTLWIGASQPPQSTQCSLWWPTPCSKEWLCPLAGSTWRPSGRKCSDPSSRASCREFSSAEESSSTLGARFLSRETTGNSPSFRVLYTSYGPSLIWMCMDALTMGVLTAVVVFYYRLVPNYRHGTIENRL